MREGWEIKTIAESTQIIAGGTPKTSIKEYWDGEIAWITPADLGKLTTREVDFTKRTITNVGLQKSSAKLFPAYSVRLSSRAPIGHLAINTVPMATNQGCRGIVPNKNLDNTYLYYFIKTNIKLLNDLGTGTTFKELSTKALGSVNIPIPPLQEQQQIVAILDQAFEAIDQAKANIEKNIANAKELFQSKLNAIFSQKGDGWEEDKLKNITTKIGSGATPRGGQAAYKESGISLIRSMNVHDAGFTSKKLAFIDDEQASKLNNVIIEENDVLLNITGASVARCCLAIKEFIPARVNQHVSIIRPIKDKIDSNYLHFLLTSKKNKDLLLGIGEQGSTRQAITKVQIENFVVSYPKSIEEQKSLIAEVTTIKSKSKKIIKIYKDKLNNLEDLKKSILQKAFAGALTNKEESVHLKLVAEPEARYSKK
jgi:type I restriction enzyme S subunit